MEKLGDYLQSHHQGMLSRILLARQLESRLQTIAEGEVKVVIKNRSVRLICVETAYAKCLELNRATINKILTELTNSPYHGLTVKIKVGH